MPLVLTLTNKRVIVEGAKRSELRALDAVTSYRVEGARFVKAFQQGYWDGREHLMTYSSKTGRYTLPIGLVEDVAAALALDGIDYQVVDERVVNGVRRNIAWNKELSTRDYQMEAHASLFRKHTLLFGCGLLKMPIRSGKALRCDQRVSTPSGWVPISELTVGSTVQGRVGWTQVLGVYPQGVKRLFRVTFDDATSVVCCQDHLWSFSRQRGASHVWVEETKPLIDWWRSTSFNSESIRLGIPEARCDHNIDLPIDPYTLGVLLGDGCLTKTGGCTVTIGNLDIDIIDSLVAVNGVSLKREKFHGRSGCVAFSFTGRTPAKNAMQSKLESIGLFGKKSADKFVPDIYMNAGTEQRAELLRGLMDTDGSVVRGAGVFTSHSTMLAQHVSELASSLGCVSRLGKNGPEEWRVHIQAPLGLSLFKCNRKSMKALSYARKKKLGRLYKTVKAIEPAGESDAVCIEVSAWDGLFVTEGFNLTHNTHTAASIIKTLGLPTVMLVPSQMLLWQTVESLQLRLPHEDIGIIGDNRADIGKLITVATMQSLAMWKGGKSKTGKKRVRDKRYDLVTQEPDVVIVDEAHHIRGESEWHKVVADFSARFRIALSATAYLDSDVEQGRGIIWLKGSIGPQRIDISESRLIKAGYLMTQHVTMKRVTGPAKFKDWRWSMELQRDGIWNNVERNQMIVDAAKQHVDRGARTLIVTSKVEQTRHLHELLCRANVDHETITGKDGRGARAEAIDEFVNGKLRCVVGTVLSEGVDIPVAEVVIVAGGGKDAKATMQRMRNMTIAEGKSKAELIDFMDEFNPYLMAHSKERLKVYKSIPEFVVDVEH